MRYQPGSGIGAERAEMIPKLLPERRDWLERELRKWPQLLDYNKQLLDALADPELHGSRWLQPDGTRAWEPYLALAYSVDTASLVSRGRWRWFYMYGVSMWGSGTEARLQDMSPIEGVTHV